MSRIDRITLDHRWTSLNEDTLLTGTQALVRLPLLRRQLDEAAGLDTAAYITGYRGSPLGNYDRELARHRARLKEAGVVFEPGLNEELAATACWGTQQLGLMPGARHQGVFAIWYGKGPGVDRSGDVLRHANAAGTAPHGGVLALAGDDPAAKSSTVTNASEYAFLDVEMPFLDPADVAEVLELGVKGIALSRASGLWVGMKCVAETMDATMTLQVDPLRFATTAPEPGDFHIRMGDTPLAAEARLRQLRLPAALAFARANGLNRIMADAPEPRFGIVVRGKAWNTLRQALQDAELTPAMLREGGVRILKLGMPWPFDAALAREFARGLEEVLVIEDRRAFSETMLRDALYGTPSAPRISGKRDPAGAPLLSELSELDAAAVLRALAARLPESLRTETLARRIAELDALAAAALDPLHLRSPHFCPGCPHNTSTRLPEGSQGMAGIGCHFLVTNMNRETPFYTQMGGEGAPWLGQRHFSDTPHMFANLGDGTYAHSGSLAVRAAIAANANLTYKILVNSAVAMTGGQKPDADVTVPRLAAQMVAEGARRVVVVGDDPARHQGDPLIPAGVTFHPRADLDAVQRELRETPGVTVLLYDQECATERRRHRKRGTAPAATRRAVINPRVCEDCGDCSRASNCIAVEPVETPWGRKRHIDQSACNQDLSCVEGFCPSFVSLEGAEPVHPAPPEHLTPPAEPLRAPQTEPWNLLLAGVGGQGVTALAAILAMAAHLEGRPVRGVDMLGLAQKGGGVYGQLRIGLPDASPETLTGPRIGQGQADLMLAADLVVAHGRFARPMLSAERSVVIASDAVAPTQQFVLNPETRMNEAGMRAALAAACRALITLPAAQAVEARFGDLIYLNVYLLGVAYQRGLVPLGAAAILRALELNGAEIARNQAAFTAGRQDALAEATPEAPETLEAMIDRLAQDLVAYQGRRTAAHYRAVLARVAAAEQPLGSTRLTRAVARQLYRLTAYKDEYEVARLHADPAWQAQLASQFQGTRRVVLHLAPPTLGERKREFGPWMLRAMGWLRHGKILRGTALDPFGRTEERRQERALAPWYEAGVEALLMRLSAGNHAAVCAWAEAAEGIKGYGAIKARNLAATRERMEGMMRGLGAG
ncbi:indolepyruvate ferredoxin oxidoreductase family protein [Rhodovarius lipocyclicus]|uniref:indolepyruvate ferredoxin oxidoreductase family protein n=1 Tax=Rhodovarius lipocyclicus TaxID=268410 RepID=UPI001358F3FB|nr:indolepyruvate ferredoxin oxidoreductase family protein [Rhodovarius lipocyclicus]